MDQHSGQERRELFETAATKLFEDIAASGGVPLDDPVLSRDRAATDLLIELGLLSLEGNQYVVVDPGAAQAAVVGPLGQQGAQLIAESARWADAFGALGQAYRRSSSTVDGPITRLRGDQIEVFLSDVVPSAQHEILTAQPQAGHSLAAQKAAGSRDVAALQRGVSMRTIYQHAARRSRGARAYVDRVTAAGGEVRTLDEFFNRLIVVDREVAIIPSGEDLTVALAIRDTDLVAYLVDIFERFWERGRPFSASGAGVLTSIAEEQRAMAIRMLKEGHSDATCAKRLGVSPRTYAGYIAELKEAYDAQTRYQLGFRMGEQETREGRRKKG